MLFNNPRPDCFEFSVPSQFFKGDIVEKYDKWIDFLNGPLRTIEDVLNESIKGIEFPGFSWSPIEQQQTATQYNGMLNSKTIDYRPSVDPQKLLESREVNVEFRHIDGYLTYFMMLEHYFNYFVVEKKHICLATLPVVIKNPIGHQIAILKLNNVQFRSITGLPLGYDKMNRQDFSSFACRFGYSDIDFEFAPPTPIANGYIPKIDLINPTP